MSKNVIVTDVEKAKFGEDVEKITIVENYEEDLKDNPRVRSLTKELWLLDKQFKSAVKEVSDKFDGIDVDMSVSFNIKHE